LAVSAAIALAASLAALYLLFRLRELAGFHWQKVGSAVLMGFAVIGMHYTGMAAATFTHAEGHSHSVTSAVDSTALGYAVGLGTLLSLVLACNTVRVDRRIAAHTAEPELKFQSVIESANDAIIVTDHEANILQWNQGAERIFGQTKEEMLGEKLLAIIPERFRKLHAAG